MAEMGDLIWSPSDARCANAKITGFINWLNDKGHSFGSYEELRQWSVAEIEEFWRAIVDYFGLDALKDAPSILSSHTMPGAVWFEGTQVNFAEYLLSQGTDDQIAIYARTEQGPLRTLTWQQLRAAVETAAKAFIDRGVTKGDRVVSYLPNCPEMAIAYLAATSLGAVWSSCAPEFGHASVVDRFSQIDPKVLLTTDGYTFAGKVYDRRTEARAIADALPHLEHIIHVPGPMGELGMEAEGWSDFVASGERSASVFKYARTDFNDPLWVVYSSGTTGLPKPFVHGHGGVMLEAVKFMNFHMDLDETSTLFYYTTTGWVMWNILMNGLVTGGSIVMFDGAPMTPDKPDILWELAEQTGITFFGASPTYIAEQHKRGIVPKDRYDMSRITSILLGGSPVAPEQMVWCLENLHDDIWITSQSGGTDIASGFVGACPLLPVHGGEIQCRCLGVDAHAFNEAGEPVIGEVGELVVSKPMPSMPLYFWNDADMSRYRSSYYEDYPGHWRHGDYFKINERGGCFILGRSDSTLNRYGVRIGTAEIYRTIEALDAVDNSLIVNLDLPGGKFFMPLFIKVKEGRVLDEALKDEIKQTLRSVYSPRHVPDAIYAVDEIPTTLTGKKLEVPVRKILMGIPVDKAASRDAMANPDALNPFIAMARERAAAE